MTKNATTPKEVVSRRSPSEWWGGKLLWGVFFVILGVLWLLSNLNVFPVEMGALWRLWPMLVIVAGLSLIPISGTIGKVIYGSVSIGVVVLMLLVMTGMVGAPVKSTGEKYSVSRSSGVVKRLAVSVDAGAGELHVGSSNSFALVSGAVSGGVRSLKQYTSTSGDVQTVDLSLRRNWNWTFTNLKSDLTVNLNSRIPASLAIDAGAASINADLTKIELESLDIDSGASALELRFGDKQKKAAVSIDTGVSSVKIHVPKTSGVELKIDSGLSSKDIPSDYTEVKKGVYQSPGFAEATKTIIIDVQMGVSSFALKAY